MLRILSTGLMLVSLIVTCDSVQAQFGRLGPVGFRPPIGPVPTPIFVGPSYVRVPGVPPLVPAVVVRPSYSYGYGYARTTTTIAVPVAPAAYSAGRVAIVQPISSSQYRAGSVGYVTPATSLSRSVLPQSTSNLSNANTTGDLRPGMVLPDGAIVLSVGEPSSNGSVANGPTNPSQPSIAPSPRPSTTPTVAPQLEQPNSESSGTSSILVPTEELPVPEPSPSTSNSTGVRKF